MKRALIFVLSLGAASGAAHAQEVCDAARGKLKELSGAIAAKETADQILNKAREVTDIKTKLACLTATPIAFQPPLEVLRQDLINKLQTLESSRVDRQEGTTGGGGGATSVVSKGPVAQVLSFATEYGALTQAVNGQTVTVRGNLAGLPTALIQNGLLRYCLPGEPLQHACIAHGSLNALSRLSFGVTFDTSRGNTTLAPTPGTATPAPVTTATPVTFVARSNQISAVNGRFEIFNHRDYTSSSYVKNWNQQVGAKLKDPGHALFTSAEEVNDLLSRDPNYIPWRERTAQLLVTSPEGQWNTIWNTQVFKLAGELEAFDPSFAAKLRTVAVAYGNFFKDQDKFLDDLAKGTVVAFEYTDTRPTGQASTSNFRLIVDWTFCTKWKLVGNAAVTIYDQLPTGTGTQVSRIRDAQAASELSYSFGSKAISGPAVLSLAGYYQYQNGPAILNVDPANPILGITFVDLPSNAKTVLAEAGSIGLAQLKLVVGPPGSSAKIPLSVTYSNRTELINKPTWKAQIGIAYNLDALFTK
jgi:hypothetical protein